LKTASGDTDLKFGENMHHQQPKRKGGGNARENLEIIHLKKHIKNLMEFFMAFLYVIPKKKTRTRHL
jgi:5-methylcytosine-specific restriction endonuclease McrA